MRILQLHSNYITYKPVQKEIIEAEETEITERKFEDLVVIFTAVEKGDNELVARKALDEVFTFLKKLKVNKILIYPYAHLSNNLAGPKIALNVIKTMASRAIELGLESHLAPFGWTKQFTISIKGHPLAEQSRVVTPSDITERIDEKEPVSEAVKAEEKLKSSWYILQSGGELISTEEFKFSTDQNLGKFVQYELSKSRASQQMPPHVILMKRLEIADYEPGSDPGNVRWYPKGRFIKSLLERFVTTEMITYGAMEVETPVMYDSNHLTLKEYLNRFPARQYILKSEDKELFLRFSACFGQFLMLHDSQISYKHLPLKIYELTRYSFRREKSGEVVGLKRLRAFTMPDCHALCANLEQVKTEFKKRFNLSIKILEAIGFTKEDYEVAFRFTKSFYQENKEFIESLSKIFGKAVLVEMWEKPFFYFRFKWDFNFIDNQDKAAALSTDQIDVENAQRYDITYIDLEGKKQHPYILHCSPSGAIERCIYALLEKAYKEQTKGNAPVLPLWLSPTQIRIIPLKENHLEFSETLYESLTSSNIRVDIDDRPLTLQKRVREAEREWIPYIIVVGKNELSSGILSVRVRKLHTIKQMTPEELIKEINIITKNKPFQSQPLPRKLTQRPQFYG